MSDVKSPTHYDVLGVKSDASKEEITKAYRRAMRVAHPDTSGSNDSPLAALVTQAYEVLRDADRRARYDASLIGVTDTSPESAWGEEDAWEEDAIIFDTPVEDNGYPAQQEESYFSPGAAVDLNKLSWWHKTGNLKDAVYLPGKKKIINPLLLSVLGLALYIGIPQFAASDTNTKLVFGSFQILGLLLLLPFAFGSKGKNSWIGFWVSGFALAAFFTVPADAWKMGVYFAVTTVVMTWAALSWRKWRAGRGAGTEDVVPLSVVRDTRVFGDPGIGLYDAMNRFGADNVARGVHGERLTANLLEHLLTLPGVRIIHGLRFPGSQRADVDHAVICGNRVAFVDSKYWAGGHWTWEAPGVVANYRTPGAHGQPREMHFQNAVDSFRKSLKGMEVAGWILIHSSDAYRVHTDNSRANGQPRLVDSQQALEEIGAWLLAGQPSVVDRRHMTELLKIKN